MNIIEAIASASNDVINLTSSYIARIYVSGIASYQKPVDVRISEIKIPLRLSDLQFIYDRTNTETNIHKTDAMISTYFPTGAEFSLTDGSQLRLTSYGAIKTYNDQIYVDMYCTLQNEGVQLIENVNSDRLKEKIKDELNIMIESNEVIKNLLPQYSSNWIKFSDDDIDAIKKFNSTKILRLIDKIDYDERNHYLTDINSALSQSYTVLPTSVTNKIKKIAEINAYPQIQAGFAGVHSYYNPRYVFEWLLYIFDTRLLEDETLYDEFYLINKIGGKCDIHIAKDDTNYIMEFIMPDECPYNFRLNITNAISVGSYTEYNIEAISLEKIAKTDPSNITVFSNVSSQPDNLKCGTKVISILSASNYEGITLSEYYANIDTYINAININAVEDPTTPEEPKQEGGESSNE